MQKSMREITQRLLLFFLATSVASFFTAIFSSNYDVFHSVCVSVPCVCGSVCSCNIFAFSLSQAECATCIACLSASAPGSGTLPGSIGHRCALSHFVSCYISGIFSQSHHDNKPILPTLPTGNVCQPTQVYYKLSRIPVSQRCAGAVCIRYSKYCSWSGFLLLRNRQYLLCSALLAECMYISLNSQEASSCPLLLCFAIRSKFISQQKCFLF